MGTESDTRIVVGGRYEIWLDDRVGPGGQGMVYRGMDLKLRRMIAAKTLLDGDLNDLDARRRLRQESRMLQFGAGPGLVQIYDYLDEPDRPWIVMELVPGPSLKAVIKAHVRLGPAEATATLQATARVLDHLHTHDVVHLDVKPQNILMHPDGYPVVIDLGLAQTMADQQDTIGGVPFGSVAYLSPEQCRRQAVDSRTDVYALGCVMFEMVTGRVPFDEPPGPGQKDAIIRRQIHEVPERPSSVRADGEIPDELDIAILRALEKAPDDRFSSAVEFAEACAEALGLQTSGETTALFVPEIETPRFSIRWHWPWRRSAAGEIREPEFDSDPAEDAASDEEFATVSKRRRLWQAGGRLSRRTRPAHRLIWRLVLLFAMGNLLLGGIIVARDGPESLVERFMAVAPGTSTTVTIDDLNLRAAPGLESTILTTLQSGDQVSITGVSVRDETGRWWPVSVDQDGQSIEGWVWADGLKENQWTGRLGFIQDGMDRVDDTRDNIVDLWPF